MRKQLAFSPELLSYPMSQIWDINLHTSFTTDQARGSSDNPSLLGSPLLELLLLLPLHSPKGTSETW